MPKVNVKKQDGKVTIEPTTEQKEEWNDEKIQKALIVTVKEMAYLLKILGEQQGYEITFSVEDETGVNIGEYQDIITKI